MTSETDRSVEESRPGVIGQANVDERKALSSIVSTRTQNLPTMSAKISVHTAFKERLISQETPFEQPLKYTEKS